MKPIHLLAGLFGVSMLLLDLVVASGFGHNYDNSLMLYAGLAFGQLALLALWLAYANRHVWMVRLLVILLVTVFLSQPLGEYTRATHAQWFTLLSLFVGATDRWTREESVGLPGEIVDLISSRKCVHEKLVR